MSGPEFSDNNHWSSATWGLGNSLTRPAIQSGAPTQGTHAHVISESHANGGLGEPHPGETRHNQQALERETHPIATNPESTFRGGALSGKEGLGSGHTVSGETSHVAQYLQREFTASPTTPQGNSQSGALSGQGSFGTGQSIATRG